MNLNEVKIINAILSAITGAFAVLIVPLAVGLLIPPLGGLWLPVINLTGFWPALGGLGALTGGAVWLFRTSRRRGFNPDRFLRSALSTTLPIVLAALAVFLLVTLLLALFA